MGKGKQPCVGVMMAWLVLLACSSCDDARDRCMLSLCRELWLCRQANFVSTDTGQHYQLIRWLLDDGVRVAEEFNVSKLFPHLHGASLQIIMNPNNATRTLLNQALNEDKLRYIWLILFEKMNISNILSYFSGMDLPYESKVMVFAEGSPRILYEVFRVSLQQPVLAIALAKCDPGPLTLLSAGRQSLLARRSNLQGLELKAVTTHAKDGWAEAYTELWQDVAKVLNFSLVITQIETDVPEGEWGTLLKEVQSDSAHISLFPVLMLPSMGINVSFSSPIRQTSLSVLVRSRASEQVLWNRFVRPFHRTLWAAMLCSVITLSIVLAALWHAETPAARFPTMLSESTLCVLGAACLQGHPSPPQSFGARGVHLIALLSSLVLVSVYSSAVTAFLTVNQEVRPFDSLSEFLLQSRFHPLLLTSSPEYSVFQDSLHPDVVKFRSQQTSPYFEAPTLNAGLNAVCGKNLSRGWLRHSQALVLPSTWTDRALAQSPCKLTHLSFASTAQKYWTAFPFAPDLPYTRVINHRLHVLHESGAILRLVEDLAKSEAWVDESSGAADTSTPKFSVELMDIIPLLALLGCGAMSALLLLSIEKILIMYHSLWRKKG